MTRPPYLLTDAPRPLWRGEMMGWLHNTRVYYWLAGAYVAATYLLRPAGARAWFLALRVLALCGNKLSAVPPAAPAPPRLQWLLLSNNRIDSWPAGVERMGELQSLQLSENELSELGPLPDSLPELDVSNNPLTELPEDFRLPNGALYWGNDEKAKAIQASLLKAGAKEGKKGEAQLKTSDNSNLKSPSQPPTHEASKAGEHVQARLASFRDSLLP